MKIGVLLKKAFHKVLRTVYNRYKTKPRSYSYKGIKIKVLPSVFHPGFFYSTKYLLEYCVANHAIQQKKILELGAGSGLISVFLAKEGGLVYASDINPKAVDNIKENARLNDLSITTYHSDLFDEIPSQIFDVVLINPPYYPQKPKNEEERAWYCGADFDYFKKLFKQIPAFMDEKSEILMVLSEDCDLQKIELLARQFNFHFELRDKRKFLGETNFIFSLSVN